MYEEEKVAWVKWAQQRHTFVTLGPILPNFDRMASRLLKRRIRNSMGKSIDTRPLNLPGKYMGGYEAAAQYLTLSFNLFLAN